MALTGATFGPAVLAPLTRYLHFARLPDGPAETGRPVPAPPFARVLRALLASSLRSALRIAGPKAAPACSSTSVLIIEKGSFARGADVSEPAQIMHFQNKIPSYLTSISQQIAPLPNERRETFYSGKFEMRIILAISQGDIKLQAALLTAGTL